MIRIHTWLVAAMLLMVSQRAAAADFYAGEVWGPYIENFTKYVDNDMELLLDSGLYSAIIWDEDGNEIETITIDD